MICFSFVALLSFPALFVAWELSGPLQVFGRSSVLKFGWGLFGNFSGLFHLYLIAFVFLLSACSYDKNPIHVFLSSSASRV